MFTVLMLSSGLLWTITYLLIIRRGFLDQTYGMPLVALCANISWEFIFSFLYPPHLPLRLVNIVWFVLDAIILAQTLRYGPRTFEGSTSVFYVMFTVALVTSFCIVLCITLDFHDKGTYSAFGQNLMMSVLFITMLIRRRSLRGQSLSIAVCKWLGTAVASTAFFMYVPLSARSVLLPFLYGAIFFYDAVYVAMVYIRHQAALKLSLDQ